MELVIITGLSGAGKSCVINALEDIGFFCIDNLPSKLIASTAEYLKGEGKQERAAIVTDIRSGISDDELEKACHCLDELYIPYKMLFIDCNEDKLISRYKQTRRSHPLFNSGYIALSDAISEEKRQLSLIKSKAHFVLDTSYYSPSDCKERIISMFCTDIHRSIHIHCMSFGFKHGIPKDADYIFDVRFLPNPFYVAELKEKTGLDEDVRSFVMGNAVAEIFEEKLHSLVDFIISECVKEGRSQLMIAIGCTGGHHRSVTFVERLCAMIKDKGYNVVVTHRDINK